MIQLCTHGPTTSLLKGPWDRGTTTYILKGSWNYRRLHTHTHTTRIGHLPCDRTSGSPNEQTILVNSSFMYKAHLEMLNYPCHKEEGCYRKPQPAHVVQLSPPIATHTPRGRLTRFRKLPKLRRFTRSFPRYISNKQLLAKRRLFYAAVCKLDRALQEMYISGVVNHIGVGIFNSIAASESPVLL